jgi:hypothetical protein
MRVCAGPSPMLSWPRSPWPARRPRGRRVPRPGPVRWPTGAGCRAGAGRSAGLRPIQDATRAMAMFSFPSADFDVDYRDVEAQKRLLRERMKGFGWLTQRILAHLDDTPDFYLDQVAQVVMTRWSMTGRLSARQVWQSTGESLSTFLLHVAVFEAVMGSPHGACACWYRRLSWRRFWRRCAHCRCRNGVGDRRPSPVCGGRTARLRRTESRSG